MRLDSIPTHLKYGGTCYSLIRACGADSSLCLERIILISHHGLHFDSSRIESICLLRTRKCRQAYSSDAGKRILKFRLPSLKKAWEQPRGKTGKVTKTMCSFGACFSRVIFDEAHYFKSTKISNRHQHRLDTTHKPLRTLEVVLTKVRARVNVIHIEEHLKESLFLEYAYRLFVQVLGFYKIREQILIMGPLTKTICMVFDLRSLNVCGSRVRESIVERSHE